MSIFPFKSYVGAGLVLVFICYVCFAWYTNFQLDVPLVTRQKSYCMGLLERTRKYDENCFGERSLPLKLFPLLITGLGGFGSHRLSCDLFKQNMVIPHERLGTHGSVAWQYAVNDVFSRSSYPHHAYLAMSSLASPRFEYIFHVTRCPLRHISAFTSHLTSTYQFIRHQMLVHNFTGISARSELYLKHDFTSTIKSCKRGQSCWLHFAALSWIFWNGHIERYADDRMRIEDGADRVVDRMNTMICTPSSAPPVPDVGSGSRTTSNTAARNAIERVEQNSPYIGLCRTLRKYNSSDVDDGGRGSTGNSTGGVATEDHSGWWAWIRTHTWNDVSSVTTHTHTCQQPSLHHRNHVEYTYTDLNAVDPALVGIIKSMGRNYGYRDDCHLTL